MIRNSGKVFPIFNDKAESKFSTNVSHLALLKSDQSKGIIGIKYAFMGKTFKISLKF